MSKMRQNLAGYPAAVVSSALLRANFTPDISTCVSVAAPFPQRNYGGFIDMLPLFWDCKRTGWFKLTCHYVVIAILQLVVLQVRRVRRVVLLRRHGLDGLVLLAEPNVSVGVEAGDVADEEVRRDGRLGDAVAGAAVAVTAPERSRG